MSRGRVGLGAGLCDLDRRARCAVFSSDGPEGVFAATDPGPGRVLPMPPKQGPCSHCGATSTPLWRKGPPDRPVLCNACGTRWKVKVSPRAWTRSAARGHFAVPAPIRLCRARGRSLGAEIAAAVPITAGHAGRLRAGPARAARGEARSAAEDGAPVRQIRFRGGLRAAGGEGGGGHGAKGAEEAPGAARGSRCRPASAGRL